MRAAAWQVLEECRQCLAAHTPCRLRSAGEEGGGGSHRWDEHSLERDLQVRLVGRNRRSALREESAMEADVERQAMGVLVPRIADPCGRTQESKSPAGLLVKKEGRIVPVIDGLLTGW